MNFIRLLPYLFCAATNSVIIVAIWVNNSQNQKHWLQDWETIVNVAKEFDLDIRDFAGQFFSEKREFILHRREDSKMFLEFLVQAIFEKIKARGIRNISRSDVEKHIQNNPQELLTKFKFPNKE